MATDSFYEESFVERDEMNYPASEYLDSEPMYSNFTAIQNAVQHHNIHQTNYQRSRSTDDTFRAVRMNILPIIPSSTSSSSSSSASSSSHHARRHEMFHQTKPFRTPIQIQSKTTDGNIFNLTRIVESIGFNPNTPYIRSPSSAANTKNVSALLNIVLKMGGANGPLVNVWRSNITNDYFEKWFLEKQQRQQWISHATATSPYENFNAMIQHVPATSTRSTHQRSSSTSSILQTNDEHQKMMFDYHQFLQEHPELSPDPNPEIIARSNPNQMTYQQNVAIRYLVPPTPPPPGPLIIREIVPPRPPTPPPLVIKQREPTPPTPPPLILREAPPPLPPRQETTVITKVLPAEPPKPQQVIFEREPALPPKPQSVIIEKWLPYKTPPPREVIYERVHEDGSAATTTQHNYENSSSHHAHRRRRHSAEYQSNSSDLIQRDNSMEHFDQTAMNQYGWNFYKNYHQPMFTHHHEQARAQFEAYQQWMAQQWQRHQNFMMKTFQTPALVVQHPPVTMMMNNGPVFERQEIRKQRVFYNVGQMHHLC